MGYEVGMQSAIIALLRLFRERARDPETNAWVIDLVAKRDKWPRAHDLFDLVRKRLLLATQDGERPLPMEQVDHAKACQYKSEEDCLKAIFNETDTRIPFDSCSPFWVAGSAIHLARALGVPISAVIAVIAPEVLEPGV
jgi:hypothetical protein